MKSKRFFFVAQFVFLETATERRLGFFFNMEDKMELAQTMTNLETFWDLHIHIYRYIFMHIHTYFVRKE